MSPRDPAQIAATLNAQREAFKAFLVSRVDQPADAEDILQTALLKAVQRADELRDDTKLTAWFYQILRHALIDYARSRHATTTREQAWATDTALASDAISPDDERALCRCFEPLLTTLKPDHAALLRLVELEGQSVASAALTLGITANYASVMLHRARAELRAQLVAFCGACATGACLDCDCA